MPRFEVVEAKAYHVGRVVHRMRPAHRESMLALGYDPHRTIRDSFDKSAFRRAWLIDGRVAAVGGVVGTFASRGGIVWIAFTEEAARYPKEIMRETRRQLAIIMATRSTLEGCVVVGDDAAWRYASRLGFSLKHPETGERLKPQSPKTSLAGILARAPGFRVTVPGRGDGVFIRYEGASDGGNDALCGNGGHGRRRAHRGRRAGAPGRGGERGGTVQSPGGREQRQNP